MLTVITALNSLFGTNPTARLRVLTVGALAVAWVTLAFVSTANTIELLFTALTMMLYLLVPWTSINLIDYFFVRRGRYVIDQLFLPDGIYGVWGARGLSAYVIGFAATVPFFVLPEVYVGPAARALGGVDIGWLVGLLVSGVVYTALSRSVDPTREALVGRV
jgi:purine-cytosine permease-like protein